MTYEVRVVAAEAMPFVAISTTSPMTDVPSAIRSGFDELYTRMKTAGIDEYGRNLVLYGVSHTGSPQLPEGRLAMDCGVELKMLPPADSDLTVLELPPGRAATVTHWGPYDQMKNAHSAIREWCKANAYSFAGPSWELYGHWSDTPSELRTDIFYLLK